MPKNVVIGNGFGIPYEWTGGEGIAAGNSDNVEASSNFVANNYYGMRMNEANRSDAGTADLYNDYFHDNLVVGGGTGLHQSLNNDAYYTSKNNRFVNNSYCLPPAGGPTYFFWLDTDYTQAQWTAVPNDATGTFSCPAVFVSSPANGVTASGTVSIKAWGAGSTWQDSIPLTKLEIYIDGALQSASNTSYLYPNTMTSPSPTAGTQAAMGASYSWNTTLVSNGSHTVMAKAYSAAGTRTTSVTVTVQNP